MKKYIPRFSIVLLFTLTFSLNTLAQQKPTAKGTVQRVKVSSQMLEGNLSGDSADRYVSVYLPASYNTDPSRRYPVVYYLHGYTDDDAKVYGFKQHWMTLPLILDAVFAKDPAHEMIVVTPDAYTLFLGSMYSNSATTGNWEDFIAKELVGYIDSHYRTIARSDSRGLSGHSMGGYGAMRIGMKNPDVFSALYLLNPCCLDSPPVPEEIPASYLRADSIKNIDGFRNTDFFTKIIFASAAAWSPNPANPPFYIDLPVKDGELQHAVLNKWDANRPLNSLDQYIHNLKQLRGIGFDAGTGDIMGIPESIKTLNNELDKYGIDHSFEIYEGDHLNRVAERIERNMMVFFSQNLLFK